MFELLLTVFWKLVLPISAMTLTSGIFTHTPHIHTNVSGSLNMDAAPYSLMFVKPVPPKKSTLSWHWQFDGFHFHFQTVLRTSTSTGQNFIIGCRYFLRKCKLPVETKILLFVAGIFLVLVFFLFPCEILTIYLSTYHVMVSYFSVFHCMSL